MTVLRVVPVITVDDLAVARVAYVDVFGMVEVMNHGWDLTVADPDDPAQQINLTTGDLTAVVDPVVSIQVDDVDAAYARAVEEGLEIVRDLVDEAWGVRRFFIRDASGSVINVLAHR